MAFVVKYPDAVGRTVFAIVEDAPTFFAWRIATRQMSAKALKECEVWRAEPLPGVLSPPTVVAALTARFELAIRVHTGGPGVLFALMADKKNPLSLAEAEALRAEIVRLWPFDSARFAALDLATGEASEEPDEISADDER